MKRLRFKPISDGISVGDLYGDLLEIYDDGKPDPKTPEADRRLEDDVMADTSCSDMYGKTIDEKRRSALLAAGGLAPDLRIGDRSIGFYDRKTGEWSKPDAE